MKKRLIALASGLTLALALTACSGGDGGSGGDAGAGVTDTTADKGLPIQGVNLKYDPNTLVNDGKPIALEWWMWDGDTMFQQFVDAYTKIHPNVTINITSQPWADYWTKLPLSLKDGNGPTLYNVHNSYHDNLINYMEPYGVPLEDLKKDYVGVDAHVIDGKVYYIDYGLMTGLVFYNKTMWSAAGLTDADIPDTWDEFAAVAKKLTIKDGDTFTQAGFNYNGLFKEFSLGMPYQQGQNLFASDQKTPELNSPAMLKVVNQFLDFYNKDGVGSKDFGPVAGESFGQGQTAMILNWGHYYGSLQKDYPNIDFGTFRTPVPQAGTTPYAFDRYNGESTLGINKGASAEQKAVAQDFLNFYLTDAKDMLALSLNYSVFPMYVPLAEDPAVKANPVLSALGSIDRYIWPGPMPATVETSIDTAWQDILYNEVDPQEALDTAQETATKDLAKTDFVSVENLYAFYKPSN